MKKKCKQCGEYKSNFSPDKRRDDGLYSYCRDCVNKTTQLYQHTKDGLITKIYSHQRQSSRKRKHKLPSYSLQELRNWCFSQEVFHKLYNDWENSGYNKKLRPSCDRIDNSKNYSLDQLCLMTWQDNHLKASIDMKSGRLISGNPYKSVEQRNLNGQIIGIYISTQEASRLTGVYQSGISRVCLGQRNQAGGFLWNFVSLV